MSMVPIPTVKLAVAAGKQEENRQAPVLFSFVEDALKRTPVELGDGIRVIIRRVF